MRGFREQGPAWRSTCLKMDTNVEPMIREVVVKLRQRGYNGMSKSFLMNAMNEYMLKNYDEHGMDYILKIVDPYYERISC